MPPRVLGVSAAALPDAERAGLLVTDRDSVRVRHPLVRSGVYQAATGHERRAVHRALADALTDDPDRQAWHRAAAADGPDADVVAALQQAADRAERRGGYRRRSRGLRTRRRAFAPASSRGPAMLFAAARNAWASGQADRARSWPTAAPGRTADDRMLRADIDRLLGRIEVNVGSAAKAYRIFSSAARAVAADDPARAVEIWVAATLTHEFDADTNAGPDAGPIPERGNTSAPWRRRADPLPEAAARRDDRRRCRRLGAGAAITARGGRGERRGRRTPTCWPTSATPRCTSATTRRTAPASRGCWPALETAAPACSCSTRCPGWRSPICMSGDWSRVRSAADEAVTLSADTGQPALGAAPLGWLTLLAALQGTADYDTLRARLDDSIAQHHLGVLTDAVHDLSRWAAGVRAANDGDAFGALHQLSRFRLPALARMAAFDRLEAAVRAGEPEQARVWLDELAVFAEATRWPWAFAAVDHGRALLADPADAPALFDRALAHHDHSGRPYDRARTHLAYGELLRRTQHRSDARPPPACRTRRLRGTGRRAAHRPRRAGTAGLGRDRPQTRPVHAHPADPDGTAGRAACRARAVEQGRRRGMLDLAADGRVPPAQRIQQDGCQLARRACPARPGDTVGRPGQPAAVR